MQMKASLLACIIAVAACGSADTASSQQSVGAVHVDVAGKIALLPIPPGADARDFHDLNVHVYNPALLMASPTRVKPLSTAAVDTTSPVCTVQSCPFSVAEVNVGQASMGLVAQLRGADDGVWSPAYTAIVGPDVTKKAKEQRAAIENNVLYAVSNASLETLAQGIGAAEGKNLTADELVARGVLIAIASGYPSEASEATLNVPPPVSGVTAAADGKKADKVQIYVPNDTYTSFSQTGVANKDGIFVVVGTKAGDMPFTITLNIKDPTGAHVWSPQMAGIGPGFTLITAYPAI